MVQMLKIPFNVNEMGSIIKNLGEESWNHLKQECIPVGCVPAERWPYSEN